MMRTRTWLAWLLVCVVAGCHTQLTQTAPPAAPPTAPPAPPPPPPSSISRFDHVFMVVLENRNYDSVIGRSSWPYLNSLAHQYAVATNYTAATHPSIGNYFMLAAGDTVTNDDSYTDIVSANNIIRRLVASGRTWTSYAEDLPSIGYVGPDQGTYTRHHNVYTLLSDVADSHTQRQHLKSFSQFPSDLAAGRLTDYVYIVPNSCDDGHDCTDAQADGWLKANIGPLIASSLFRSNCALIITFDESQTWSPSSGNGWKVPWIAIGPRARAGYRSGAAFNHAATLRFILEALGVTTGLPGAAASASRMTGFFTP